MGKGKSRLHGVGEFRKLKEKKPAQKGCIAWFHSRELK